MTCKKDKAGRQPGKINHQRRERTGGRQNIETAEMTRERKRRSTPNRSPALKYAGTQAISRKTAVVAEKEDSAMLIGSRLLFLNVLKSLLTTGA